MSLRHQVDLVQLQIALAHLGAVLAGLIGADILVVVLVGGLDVAAAFGRLRGAQIHVAVGVVDVADCGSVGHQVAVGIIHHLHGGSSVVDAQSHAAGQHGSVGQTRGRGVVALSNQLAANNPAGPVGVLALAVDHGAVDDGALAGGSLVVLSDELEIGDQLLAGLHRHGAEDIQDDQLLHEHRQHLQEIGPGVDVGGVGSRGDAGHVPHVSLELAAENLLVGIQLSHGHPRAAALTNGLTAGVTVLRLSGDTDAGVDRPRAGLASGRLLTDRLLTGTPSNHIVFTPIFN